MRVGLVLGAGGVQGGAWLTGGLDALADGDRLGPGDRRLRRRHLGGLDDRRAAAPRGVPPWFMVAHSRRRDLRGRRRRRTGRPAAEADRAGGAGFQLERAWPPIGPGSWRLALRTLAQPAPLHARDAWSSGWLPRGIISTEPLRGQVRRVVPSGWSPHPNLWVVACDYATGRAGRVRPRRRAPTPSSPTPSPPRARSPASTTRSRSAGAATSTAASTRPPTSTSCATRSSTSSSASTRPPPSTRSARSTRASGGDIVFRRASGRRLGSEAKKLRAGRHRGRADPAAAARTCRRWAAT